MQQTETYKLNLIDMDDTFSPQPINENMGKLETALSALGGADAALDGRVTALEAHKVVIGTYRGNGTSASLYQTIHLGFTPLAVFVMGENSNPEMATRIFPCRSNVITIKDGGFVVGNTATYINVNGRNYVYLAIL